MNSRRLSIVFLTGQSGSGKSTAMRALEDEGYFCIDNLPIQFAAQLVESIRAETNLTKLGLVMDIRDPHFTQALPGALKELRQGIDSIRMIYLEASEDFLIQRFSETRRPHPLDSGGNLKEAIRKEMEQLVSISELADETVNTSGLTPHALRKFIRNSVSAEGQSSRMQIVFLSFGFKYGIPHNADTVLDVRFIPNPYFDKSLRDKTGIERPVQQFVLEQDTTRTFLEHACNMLSFLLPKYQQEGKHYLTIAVGCTGGKHRSVAIATELMSRLQLEDTDSHLRHRDLGRYKK